MGSKYEWEEEHRDVQEVKEALDLGGQPLNVDIVGRHVTFRYPVPKKNNNE